LEFQESKLGKIKYKTLFSIFQCKLKYISFDFVTKHSNCIQNLQLTVVLTEIVAACRLVDRARTLHDSPKHFAAFE